MAGISRTTAYNHRHDPRAVDFREAWEGAVAQAMAVLVDVALSRAVDGVEQPVFGVEGQIGTRTVYSDAMLRYLIERRHAFAPVCITEHDDGSDTIDRTHTPRTLAMRLDRIDPGGRVPRALSGIGPRIAPNTTPTASTSSTSPACSTTRLDAGTTPP